MKNNNQLAGLKISDRDKRIYLLRSEGKTYTEISKEFDLSVERVKGVFKEVSRDLKSGIFEYNGPMISKRLINILLEAGYRIPNSCKLDFEKIRHDFIAGRIDYRYQGKKEKLPNFGEKLYQELSDFLDASSEG